MSAQVQQLQRHFGGQLDKEVLEAVLEMCGNDVSAAIKFLEIQAGNTKQQETYNTFVAQQQSGASSSATLPADYMTKPSNWMHPNEITATSSSSNQEVEISRTKKAETYKSLFLNEASLEDHFKHQTNPETSAYYTSVLILMLHSGIELSHITKSRVLAGYWGRRQYDMANYLLTKYDKQFGLIEVLKALKILDCPRRIRQIEKKINKIKGSCKPKTLNKLRAQINDLKQDYLDENICKLSVSGALAKRVRRWVTTIDREKLSFFALHLPKEPWQELCDIIHAAPKDFQLEWFLSVTFNQAPPAESIIVACSNMQPSNILDIVKKYKVPYSYLRKKVPQLSPEVKLEVAKYETIDTLVWWYEEISADCPQVADVVNARLSAGETPSFGYGKLMERCLFFKLNNASFYDKIVPIAETKLKEIQLPLEPVVVVCGDSSFSMDVAIRTSTIISSVVVALTVDPELKFFNVTSTDSPYLPKTASSVLDLATTTSAAGLTAPACVIMPYYKQKKPIKFFIMVTDEIENEKHQGFFFAQLFYKYYTEVYPAKLVMISFLENPNLQQKGRMVKALESFGIQPMQFVLDSSRPDLTKLDKILATLSTETNFFGVQVEQVLEAYKKSGNLAEALNELKALKQPERIKSASETPGAEPAPKAPVEEDLSPQKNKKPLRPQEQLEDGIPIEFICPITQEVMEDPVTAADGYNYERKAITEWFEKNARSPVSGVEVEVKMVFPNYSLRSRIKEFQGK